MVSRKYPLVAREGWPLLALVLVLGLSLAYLLSALFVLPFVILFFALLYLFRDPERRIPPKPLGLVSPVDGRIVAIEKVDDPFISRSALRIDIDVAISDVYSVHSPIEGKLTQQWHGDSVAQEVKYAQCIETDEKDVVVWGAKPSSVIKPQCYFQPGERVGQGQRCGYLIFGGKIVMFIPVNSRIEMQSGDVLVAGESVVASLIHQQAVSGIHD
jgi:phosphatidylserine decarboxylase